MEYRVSKISKDEFLRLWDIVLLARDGTIKCGGPLPLSRVSDRVEDFCEEDRLAISAPGYVGMYYNDGQIWLKPDEPFAELQQTAIHELAHHEVPIENHGPKWRRVFGTALALHLRECGESWPDIRFEVGRQVVYPYLNHRTVTDPVEQAWKERKEVDSIIRNAVKKIPTLTYRGKYA